MRGHEPHGVSARKLPLVNHWPPCAWLTPVDECVHAGWRHGKLEAVEAEAVEATSRSWKHA